MRRKASSKTSKEALQDLSTQYLLSRTDSSDDSPRYLFLLRKLAMKLRLRLPREVKHSYCKHCKQPFIPGKNCRVRTRDGKLVYYCMHCKNYTRYLLESKTM